MKESKFSALSLLILLEKIEKRNGREVMNEITVCNVIDKKVEPVETIEFDGNDLIIN